MSKPIDYDAPRRATVDLDEDSPNELKIRTPSVPSSDDPDEAEAAGSFEPGTPDPSGEELTAAVMPMRSDEFRCSRCFLIYHRTQRATGHDICDTCSGR